MKITKKIIIILAFMITMIATLGIAKVDAAGPLPTKDNDGVNIDYSKLKLNASYHIAYKDDYLKKPRLYCVEEGQHLNSKGEDYKLMKHIRIENSQSWTINSKGKKLKKQTVSTENKKISKDYNKKLAIAIATLDKEEMKEKEKSDLQCFLWGDFKTWVDKVGKATHKVPSDFAIKKQGENFKEIDEEVEEKLEDMLSSVDDFEDVTDYNNITFEPIKIGKEEFEKIGPFKLTGIPSGGLKKFEVKDQNDKKIDGIKLLKTSKKSDIIIDANDMSQNKGDTKVIKNNKPFYICIPKSKKVTQFSTNIVAEKTDITNVTADLYLLKCDDKEWQNLVITKGNIDAGKKDVDISTNKITMPGDLTIIKKGSNNNELLSGAQFVIFRYVENDKGSWYKKGDTYTQNPEEATDKNKKYKREYVRYVGNKYFSYDITSKTIDFDYVKGTQEYIYTTDKNGKIQLASLEKGTYFAKEIKAPEGYKIIDKFFKLGEVKSAQRDKEVTVTNEHDTTNLEITKVNAANHAVVLEGVGFKFKHETEGWLKEISKGKYGYNKYKKNENEATLFKTDNKGKISLPAVRIGKYTYVEDEKTLPDGYVIDNKGEKSFTLKSQNKNEVTIENIQKYVKLSGYVWLDQLDGKKSERNDVYEPYAENELGSKDLLFNGITVRLKNRDTGETIATTTTSKLNRYKDINNGNGEYLFEKVEIANLGKYYIEFEYDGLTYTNVIPHIDQNNGSKAAESITTRDNFNKKFSVVEGSGRDKGYTRDADGKIEGGVSLSYNINQEKYKAILNSNGQYKVADDHSYIQQENIGSYPITAITDEPRKDNKISYSIKDHFKVGELEIKYINLGLYKREQPDITLGKELRNVKVTVNGYTHMYDYNERYNPTNQYKEGDFNVGVQFKNGYSGTYTRAMYQSDYEYNPNDKDKELKVYITYELKMLQTNPDFKAKINSVVDYFDAEYSLETVGTKMDVADIAKRNSQGELEGKITDNKIESYNDNYKKVIIPCETELNPQEINSIYVQFKLSRDQVVEILRDKDIGQVADDDKLLNNVAEINSYSIFDKETGKIYAGIDQDSNPGNCEPGNFDTYEDDTDSSPALRLEVADAREMSGKVFEDNVIPEKNQDAEKVMTGKERKGNGEYDEGEKGIGQVEVALKDAKSGIVYKTKTVTEDGWYHIDKKEKDENGVKEYTFTGTKLEQNDGNANTHELKKGDYYIIGYIPGDYTLTYTWGDKTYTVQDYKGTIYPDPDRQTNPRWWYVEDKYDKDGEEQNTNNVHRYSDATDDYKTRQDIDALIGKINKNINVEKVEKAYEENSESMITEMDSHTPTMEIGVEYRTAYTESQGKKYSYCIDKIDFGIVERAKQDLVLNKRIKTMKVFSARGDQLVNLTIDEEGNISGEKNSITYMEPSPNATPKNGFIKLELDNETIQGTKLEVGYEIKAYNNSEVDYTTENYYKYGDMDDAEKIVTITPTGVIDYLDKNWAFDPKQNEQWQVKTSEELKGLVAEVVYDNKESTLGEKTILYTDGLKEALKPNGSKDIMLNVSKILTTTDEISLDNETEEVEVIKTGGATLETIPGNYVPGNGAKEADESMAETTIVTPATGEDLNYMIPIIIGTTALIILGVGIIIIKKKVV